MPESVLLTGFPSFTARKMAEELVRSPDVVVHAVVRASSHADAKAALDVLPLAERRRVHLIEGDAAAIDLGPLGGGAP